MSPHRIAAIVLVIGAGLVGSYLIIRNSVPAVPAGQTEGPVTSPKPLAQNPVKWLEEAAKFLNDPAKNLANSDSFLAEKGNNTKTENNSSVNLTELIAKSLFGQMQKSDQSEENPFQGQGFDVNNPQNQQLIQEAVASLDSQSIIPNQSVDDRDLKISDDNSLAAKSKYLEVTGKIILDNSSEFYKDPSRALQDLAENNNSSGVDKLADSYSKIYSGFLNTPVPSDWLDLHKRYVSFLKNTEIIYREIANFQNDPIKSQLLIQILPEIANVELGMKQEYYQKVRKINS